MVDEPIKQSNLFKCKYVEMHSRKNMWNGKYSQAYNLKIGLDNGLKGRAKFRRGPLTVSFGKFLCVYRGAWI